MAGENKRVKDFCKCRLAEQMHSCAHKTSPWPLLEYKHISLCFLRKLVALRETRSVYVELNFYVPSNYMKKSLSWETYTRSANQEISRLLWNPKVHYRVHNSPPVIPILCYMNPVRNLAPCFFKIYFNTFLLCSPWSPKWSRQVFQLKFCAHFMSLPCVYMPRPSHAWFGSTNIRPIWCRV